MGLYEEVKKIRETQLEIYKKDPIRFKAEYENQKNMAKEYNGRQILEILQNADDSHSTFVKISLNCKENLFEIENDGEPFSSEGIRSLMVANASPKRGGRYIGNKGLGFRSLITWGKEINIISQDCKCTFSKERSARILNKELGFSEEKLSELRKEFNYSNKAIFFPFFGLPDLEIIPQNQKHTIIQIHYIKDFENDIKKQLEYVSKDDKSLLFLDNLKRIIINADNETYEVKAEAKQYDKYTSIKLSGQEWFVLSDIGEYPYNLQDEDYVEKKLYSAKIAWKNPITLRDNKLYSFFPTQISLELPCVIHGSFEIDTARNHLISDSEANKFVFRKIILLIQKVLPLIKEQAGPISTWDAYYFINHNRKNNDQSLICFYDSLDKLLNTEDIYPTINNKYISQDDYKFYSEDFASFVEDNYSEIFTKIVKKGVTLKPQIYEKNELQTLIDKIHFKDYKARATFIMALYRIKDINPGRFNILVNGDDEVIESTKPIFTARSDINIQFPKEFVSFDIMKKELYEELIKTSDFRHFVSKVNDIDSRKLAEMLSDIANIQPYDISTITERIINRTNSYCENKSLEEKKRIIKKTVQCLYHNYKLKTPDENVRQYNLFLISRNNTIEKAENLYFSNSYNTGKEVERIFGSILSANEYLINKQFWEFEDNVDTDIDDFFSYFGVIKYCKISKKLTSSDSDAFIEYHKKHDKSKHLRDTPNPILSALKIQNFNKIRQINNLTDIVIVIYETKEVLTKLTSQNFEPLEYKYHLKTERINSFVSFISYQFIKSKLFTDFLIEDLQKDLLDMLNDNKSIDYPELEKRGIQKDLISVILKSVGAKQSFTNLSSEKIYKLLVMMPKVNRLGKNISTIYKMAREALAKKNKQIPIPSNLQLFATQEGISSYHPYDSVYYSDNNILPKKISYRLPFLNMPRRNGEEKVQAFFGVTLCSFEDLKIFEPIQNHRDFAVFDSFFSQLKPYILAYRIASQKEESSKKEAAKELSKLSIRIITNGQFKYKNWDIENLTDYDFILEKNDTNTVGYIKVPNYPYKELLNKVDFQTAFSEIISIVFKLTDSSDIIKDIRSTLSYSELDLRKIIISDLSDEILEKSYSLLNQSFSAEFSFWKNVYLLCENEKKLPTEECKLRECIINDFKEFNDILLSEIDYDTFSTQQSIQLLTTLVKLRALSLKKILKHKNLVAYHKKQFKEIANSNNELFNKLLWLNNKKTQEKYKNTLDAFNMDSFEDLATKYPYEFINDYTEPFNSFIKKKYHIDLSNNIDVPDYTGSILEEYLPYKDKLSNEYQYLLYYPNNLDRIKELTEEIERKRKERSEKDFDANEIQLEDEETERVEFPNDGGTEAGNSDLSGKDNTNPPDDNDNDSDDDNDENPDDDNHGGVANGASTSLDDIIGGESEKKVYTKFIDLYGSKNVKWVSKYSNTSDRNDKLHYDIRYRESETSEWRYLEVKTFSKKGCFISTLEVAFGLENKTKYDIAFVEGNKIHRIKQFFNLKKGQTLESNDNFALKNTNYRMSLRFKKSDEIDV